MLQLDVPDRTAWRTWLAEHHGSVDEVWLIFYKGAMAHGKVNYGEAVEEALCFGWIDGLVRRIDDDRYMYRFTPRRAKSTWSASNKQRIGRLLETGRMTDPGRRVVESAKRDGSWDLVPDAEKEWAMPIEFQAVLDNDPVASAAYESSSPSHRRQFVMWVASAKRAETRQRRAAKAAEMLRGGIRPM